MNFLYDSDADTSVLTGKHIAIIGYGSQGRAQAHMLHESGFDVTVGVREEGRSWNQVVLDGLPRMTIRDASKWGDIVHILIPDETHGETYERDIKEHIISGKTLSFSHGFSITFREIIPPKDVDVILVAPLALGTTMLKKFHAGEGVPALIAVHQNASSGARATALAMAKALKTTQVGVMECTFADEMVTDLFGEQAVITGGLVQLMEQAFTVLVQHGYPPEVAYFACFHEVKFIADLLHERGISGMYAAVSNTAEYGGRMAGPKIIDHTTTSRMEEILRSIEDGSFAKQWLSEHRAGLPNMKAWREADHKRLIEEIGKKLRERFIK